MKSIAGQYECAHRSGVGLDYFTSRLDRLTLQTNGRFVLTTQERSRITHAAHALMSGQQISTEAPETRREGSYTYQGNDISFHFDDGAQEQGQLTANGMQIGADFFEKVSDSTLLPPTHRLKKDMDDIARGLKIAGTIGGAAIKAAKTIQDTLQTAQNPQQPGQTSGAAPTSGGPPQAQRYQGPAAPASQQTPPPAPVAPARPSPNSTPGAADETLFCDQCGAPARPGKLFCNRCGARLP